MEKITIVQINSVSFQRLETEAVSATIFIYPEKSNTHFCRVVAGYLGEQTSDRDLLICG